MGIMRSAQAALIDPRTARRLSQTINRTELTPTNSRQPATAPIVHSDLTVFVNKTGSKLQRGYIVWADGRDSKGRLQAKKFTSTAIDNEYIQWVVVVEKGKEIPLDGEFLASRLSQRPGIVAVESGTPAIGAKIGAAADKFKGVIGNDGFSITSLTRYDIASSEVEAGFFRSKFDCFFSSTNGRQIYSGRLKNLAKNKIIAPLIIDGRTSAVTTAGALLSYTPTAIGSLYIYKKGALAKTLSYSGGYAVQHIIATGNKWLVYARNVSGGFLGNEIWCAYFSDDDYDSGDSVAFSRYEMNFAAGDIKTWGYAEESASPFKKTFTSKDRTFSTSSFNVALLINPFTLGSDIFFQIHERVSISRFAPPSGYSAWITSPFPATTAVFKVNHATKKIDFVCDPAGEIMPEIILASGSILGSSSDSTNYPQSLVGAEGGAFFSAAESASFRLQIVGQYVAGFTGNIAKSAAFYSFDGSKFSRVGDFETPADGAIGSEPIVLRTSAATFDLSGVACGGKFYAENRVADYWLDHRIGALVERTEGAEVEIQLPDGLYRFSGGDVNSFVNFDGCILGVRCGYSITVDGSRQGYFFGRYDTAIGEWIEYYLFSSFYPDGLDYIFPFSGADMAGRPYGTSPA